MSADADQFPGRLLQQAAIYNNDELMESLLEGPEREYINVTDSFGRTALYTSVTNNSYECCQLLLLNGGTVESRCSVLGCNVFSPITYCCYRCRPGRRFIWPENSAYNVPAYNVLLAVMNYYALPSSHQLADFLSAITYHACVHCNAAISPLHLATATDITTWQWQVVTVWQMTASYVNVRG